MASLDELLKNPEKFKIGDNNYKSSNRVFLVNFNDTPYIIEKPSRIHRLKNWYYHKQDKQFYGALQICTAEQALEREAKVLQELDGFHAPKLCGLKYNTLAREYITGMDFREIKKQFPREISKTLDGGFDAMEEIHKKGKRIGDPHVKNIFKRSDQDEAYCWFGFYGVYNDNENNLVEAKAADVLKFVYTIWTETRNEAYTLDAAEIARQHYDPKVKAKVKELVTPGYSASRLWFPTRLPLDGKLNEKIKEILRS